MCSIFFSCCVHSCHLFRASIWSLSLWFLPSFTFRSHAYLLILQLSFQMWTHQMQDTLNSKKKGDVAFRHKDFRAAIECYTQVKTLTTCIQHCVITCNRFQNCCLPSATSFLVGNNLHAYNSTISGEGLNICSCLSFLCCIHDVLLCFGILHQLCKKF